MNFCLFPARRSQEASQATQALNCRRELPPQMGLFRKISHSQAFSLSRHWLDRVHRLHSLVPGPHLM